MIGQKFNSRRLTTDLYTQDDRHLWLGLLPLPLNYIRLIMFDTGDPLTHTDDVKITYPLSNTLFSSFYINRRQDIGEPQPQRDTLA